MKALHIRGPGDVEIAEVATPEAGPGEVLVKVLAVTTCPHWDMHILGGEPMFPGMKLDYPYTVGQPGHEACGDVVAVGEGVTSVAEGDRVCVWRDRGHNVQGCYAQYVAVDEASVIPVPATLAPEHCAPLELAMCASAHVMYAEQLDALAGQRVGVFGLGPAGLVFGQLARAAGAVHVTGFDPLAERRAVAGSMGFDAVLGPMSDEAAALPKRGEEGCFECAFDCVGIPAAVHQAMSMTMSLVVLFAVQREPYVFGPEYWSRMTLAGARPHTREAAEYAAERLADGRLDLSPLVTYTMTFDSYAEGIEMLRKREAVKIAFLPQEG